MTLSRRQISLWGSAAPADPFASAASEVEAVADAGKDTAEMPSAVIRVTILCILNSIDLEPYNPSIIIMHFAAAKYAR
jgi:hypothetical protein